MDDLEQHEEWYREVFQLVRNEDGSLRTLQDWLDEFDVAIRNSRLRHPTVETMAIGIIKGISAAQNTLEIEAYRYGEQNE